MTEKKAKAKSIHKAWVPKKREKVENQFAFHLGLLEKYSKKIPKKIPVALTLSFGTNVPTRSYDTGQFIRQ